METGPRINLTCFQEMDEGKSHQQWCQKKVAGKRKKRKAGRGGFGNRKERKREVNHREVDTTRRHWKIVQTYPGTDGFV